MFSNVGLIVSDVGPDGLATIEEKFRTEEVCGEMLALYGAQSDHMLLKHDLGLTAGRARALHSAICAFVHGTALPSSTGAFPYNP